MPRSVNKGVKLFELARVFATIQGLSPEGFSASEGALLACCWFRPRKQRSLRWRHFGWPIGWAVQFASNYHIIFKISAHRAQGP
ncbi:hypothetical protein TM1040_1435 [Ruegeria sp. TM1040]|nr:hypothetical protein TM1040_1435 [Ruegeria sp. TM1040]